MFTFVYILQKTGEIDWSRYWEPRLYIDNVVGEPRETVWHTVMFDREMRAFVFEKRRIAGTFVENLELYQFPFDTQVRRFFLLHALWGGHFGIARSVRPSVPRRSCLGCRHAGCLQLSHRRPPEMCGLRTRPRTDVDPPRFLDP